MTPCEFRRRCVNCRRTYELDARRAVFDRGWNEKRVFGVIAQNPLDYTSSQEVMAWVEAHPWAHVASFTAK